MNIKNKVISKVLFIDKDEELKILLEQISSLNIFNTVFSESFDEIKDIYQKGIFDIVIVNFSLKDGVDILDYILSIDPEQKTITLSEELICSDERGCELCQRDFNKKRLLKPITINKLINAINNFDNTPCRYQDKFNCTQGLIEIMPEILNRYNSVNYDDENKLVKINNISDVIEMFELFKDKDIALNFINDNELKITTKG